ncbi:MAG: DNA ligase [Venatoribacter sp.]
MQGYFSQLILFIGFFSAVAWSAPELTLANQYNKEIDLTQYWVSEKYDGVRAYWDGKTLYARSGRKINAPVSFIAQLPSMALDGELWFGRGQFSRANSLLKLTPDTSHYLAEWQAVRYLVFDTPSSTGSFAQRMALLNALPKQPNLEIVKQESISSHAELERKLQAITTAGAEGLMLRRIDAPYRGGRSDDLLKLKLWLDAEATVLSYIEGKGKYQGRLGSLVAKLDDGRTIRIGTGFSDEERLHPPQVGSRVTFRYLGLTSTGLPRFPVYWRQRNDY